MEECQIVLLTENRLIATFCVLQSAPQPIVKEEKDETETSMGFGNGIPNGTVFVCRL